MWNPKKHTTALSVVVAAGAIAWGVSQRSAISAKPAFTIEDYVEIQQLYGRYAHAFDLDPDGTSWADTFTDDGAHGETKGRANLIAYARAAHKRQDLQVNARNRRHWNSQLVITPTPEGADGTCFLLMVVVGGGKTPPQLSQSMVYHDKLVKTSKGWRFKQRLFDGEQVTPNPGTYKPLHLGD